ncbi:MAG: hypothetical protein ABIH23_03565 [bacterium]
MVQKYFYAKHAPSGLGSNVETFEPPVTYGALTSTGSIPIPPFGWDQDNPGPFWILFSCGPDRMDSKIYNGWFGLGRFIYDVSNGLMSFGDIVRAGGDVSHDTRFGVLWDPRSDFEERKPGYAPWKPGP